MNEWLQMGLKPNKIAHNFVLEMRELQSER